MVNKAGIKKKTTAYWKRSTSGKRIRTPTSILSPVRVQHRGRSQPWKIIRTTAPIMILLWRRIHAMINRGMIGKAIITVQPSKKDRGWASLPATHVDLNGNYNNRAGITQCMQNRGTCLGRMNFFSLDTVFRRGRFPIGLIDFHHALQR